MTRYLIKQKDDPHGQEIAMYVANLPTALTQIQYDKILIDIIGKGKQLSNNTPPPPPPPNKVHNPKSKYIIRIENKIDILDITSNI